MTSLGEAVADARTRFDAAGLPNAAMEARILIAGLLKLTSTEVFANADRILTDMEAAMIDDSVARRLKREPVHRILGAREFYGMTLTLSKETLEPRPDTEILIEILLPHLRRIASEKDRARVLDLGTGTGAIALALLKGCAEAQAVGTDISDDALRTAQENAVREGVAERFEAIRSDWFTTIRGRFDIIVSNPPYIKQSAIAALEPEVRDFDPYRALNGGIDGLDAYRAIATGAQAFLEKDGIVGVEIGFDQKDSVTGVFAASGFALQQAARDYGDNDRVLVFSAK